MNAWARETLNGVYSTGADELMPKASSLRLFLYLSWLILFPVGCGIAVLSFTVAQTMSGRVLGIYFNPCTFGLAIGLFSITGWATYYYFKKKSR